MHFSRGIQQWLVFFGGTFFGVLCFFLTKSKSIFPWDWAKIIPLILPSLSLVLLKFLPMQSSDPMDPYLFSIGIAIGFISVMLGFSKHTTKWIEVTGQRENGCPLRVVMSAQATVSEAEKILSDEARGPIALQNLTGEVIPSSSDLLLSKFPGSAKERDIFGVLRLDLFVVWSGSPEGEQISEDLPIADPKQTGKKFSKISSMLKRSKISLFSPITESSLPVCGESVLMDAIVDHSIGNGGMTVSRVFNVVCKRGFALAEPPLPRSSPSLLSGQKEIDDCRLVRLLPWNIEKNEISNIDAADPTPFEVGDLVVLENSGKYAYIHRGWWLAWSSTAPKRSGVFYIEYPSQRSQMTGSTRAMVSQFDDDGVDEPVANTLTTTTEVQGHSASFKRGPPVAKFKRPVRVRFRSLKFPDFELGFVKQEEAQGGHVLGIQRIIMENTDSWISPCDFEIRPYPKRKGVFNKITNSYHINNH